MGLGTAVAYLTLDATGFARGIDMAIADAKRLNTGFSSVENTTNRVGKKISGLGTVLTAGITAPILGFAAASVKSGAEFDKAMSDVKAVSMSAETDMKALSVAAKQLGVSYEKGATDADTAFNALRATAIKMGNDTKFTAKESADALYYMGLAGWSAEQSIAGIPAVLYLASAGNTELATTSDIVTDAITGFGHSAQETVSVMRDGFNKEIPISTRLADIMASTMANSNTDVDMLGQSFKYVTPIAGSFGYSMEDVSLSLGLMANAGVKASQAGTTLRQGLKRLVAPTDKAQAVMNKYGWSAADATGNIKPLRQQIKELRGIFGELDIEVTHADGTLKTSKEIFREYGRRLPVTEQEKLNDAVQVFGTTALPGMLSLMNQSDEALDSLANAIDNSSAAFVLYNGKVIAYKDAIKEYGKEVVNTSNAFKVLGSAEAMSLIQLDNLKGDWTLFKSALGTTKQIISDMVNGPLRDLVKRLTELTRKFNEMSPEQQNHIVKLAAMVAAIGPALLAIGKMITALGNFKKAISTAGSALKAFGATGFGPTLAILAGIASVALLIKRNWDKLKPIFKKLKNVMVNFAKSVQSKFKTMMDKISPLVEKIDNVFVKLVNTVVSIVTRIVGFLEKIIDTAISVVETLEPVFDSILDLVNGLLPPIEELVDVILDAVEQILPLIKTLFEELEPILTTVVNIIGNVLPPILRTIASIISAITPTIKTLVKILGDVIKKVAEKILPIIKKVADVLDKVLPPILETITGLFEDLQPVLESLGNIMADKIAIAIDVVSEAFNILWEVLSPVIESIANSVTPVFDALGTAISSLLNALESILSPISDLFGFFNDDNNEKVAESAAGITELKEVFKQLGDAVSGMVDVLSVGLTGIGDFVGVGGDLLTVGLDVMTGQFDKAEDDIQKTTDDMEKTFEDLGEGVGNAVAGMVESMTGLEDVTVDEVAVAWEKVWTEDIPDALGDAADWIGDKVDNLASNAETLWNDMCDSLADDWDALVDVIEDIAGDWESIFEELGNFLSDVGDSICDVWDDITTAVEDAWDGICDGMDKILEWAGDFLTDIGDAIGDVASWFYDIGSDIVNGIWEGITSAWDWLCDKVGGLFDGLVGGVKDLLGIHSPSKVFEKQVGLNIVLGLAKGIIDNSSKATDATQYMLDNVLKVTGRAYDKQYNVVIKSLAKTQKQIDKIEKQIAKTSDKNEKEKLKKKLANLKEEKKETKKALSDLQSDYLSYSNKQLSQEQKLYNMSNKQIVNYWKEVRSHLKKGTKAYKEATQEIVDARIKMYAEMVSEAEDALNKMKEERNVSLAEEINYWSRVRDECLKGSIAYQEATDKINAAQKALTNGTNEAFNVLKDGMATVAEGVKKSVQDIVTSYNEAVSSTKETLMGLAGLFEAFTVDESISGNDLVSNLQTQVDGLEQWNAVIDKMFSRGLPQELIEELQAMGPKAMGSITNLLNMSDEKLSEYIALWERKNAEAQSAALKMVDKTPYVKQIQETIDAAGEEVKKLVQQYNDSLAKLGYYTEENAKTMSVTFSKNFTDALKKDLGNTDFGFIGDIFKEERFSGLGTTISRPINEAMIKSLQNAVETAASTVESNSSALTEAVQNAVSEEKVDVSGYLDVGVNVVGNITTGVKSQETTLNNQMKSTGTNSQNTFINSVKAKEKDVNNEGFSVGKRLDEGMEQGINAYVGNVIAAAIAAVQAAIAAAKAAAAISSPSKVMANEVGKWLPLGIAKGFVDYTPEATGEMQDAIDDSLSYLQTKDIDIFPNVKNVGEEVRDAFKDISHWFADVSNSVTSMTDTMKENIQDVVDITDGMLYNIYDSGSDNLNNLISGKNTTSVSQDTVQKVVVGDIETQGQTNNTFIFNSPKPIDEVQASRLIRQTSRNLAEGFG